MSTKEAVLELIRRIPDDVTVPDIMAELSVRQKIDEGLRQREAGQGIDHEEARKRLARWRSWRW
jgi:predicted transcriptional regulator